jgi:hypothetical protein
VFTSGSPVTNLESGPDHSAFITKQFIFSIINRTVINWNQLPADLLASFTCKLNTFRNKLKKVAANK